MACPQTIDEWRKAKASAVEEGVNSFKDTIDLAELGLKKCIEIHEAIQPVNPNDDRVLLDFMLLGTHRQLLNCFDLLLERQNLEAMAVLRSAVELAANAAKIGRVPSLARVWLKRDEDEGAFNAAFKPMFPPGDPLTGPLYKTYTLACNYGAHSNASLIVMHTTIDKKQGGAVDYFLKNDAAQRRHLVHFVVTILRILNVYVDALKGISKADVPSLLSVWTSAVDVHKQKFAEEFNRVES